MTVETMDFTVIIMGGALQRSTLLS